MVNVVLHTNSLSTNSEIAWSGDIFELRSNLYMCLQALISLGMTFKSLYDLKLWLEFSASSWSLSMI